MQYPRWNTQTEKAASERAEGSSAVKHLPAMQETQVQSLGQEDPLEKEIVTHSSILVWEIAWTEEPGGLQPMESKKLRQELVTKQQQ